MRNLDWQMLGLAILVIVMFMAVGLSIALRSIFLISLFTLLGFGLMGFGLSLKKRKSGA
ncbi:DUF5325 family protein [Oceanobacillus piezotolerans]|uniref:DUF5325 family protein n=1 Tax=Oceanobacillus piezotolerans TaxID=2448030 RepID=UPI0013146403|nr:DUF5325 family protein [Oceanobacillus piezotolerans]